MPGKLASKNTGRSLVANLTNIITPTMDGSECLSAHYHLARIYALRGDTAEALRSLRAYLDDAPKGEYVSDARELEKKLQQQSKH